VPPPHQPTPSNVDDEHDGHDEAERGPTRWTAGTTAARPGDDPNAPRQGAGTARRRSWDG
jgi:hypothetical protein